MGLKSQCNHYLWESLDVTESSDLGSLGLSWLPDALSCVTSLLTTGDRLQAKQTFDCVRLFQSSFIHPDAPFHPALAGSPADDTALCVNSP